MTHEAKLLALADELEAACVGHPHAKIAWPHRLLHEAAAALRATKPAVGRCEKAGSAPGSDFGPFTKAEWLSIPMPLRRRWWLETDYGKCEPSAQLIADCRALLPNDGEKK